MNERDWALLNAYADGELSRAERENLSARLEREPALAADLRRIRMLKMRTADLRELSLQAGVRSGRPFLRTAGIGVAASLLIAGLTSLAMLGQPAGPAPQNLVLALHADFSAVTDPQSVSSANPGAPTEIPPPDLTGSNLRLVEVRSIREARPAAVGYHYRGPRGCRLTLVVGTSLDLPSEMDLAERWTVGDRMVVMVADGMDPQRFAAIAGFAKAATKEEAPGDNLRLALVERTAAARPCT